MLRKKKSFKSIISLILVSLLILGCCPITAGAVSVSIANVMVESVSIFEETEGYIDSDYNEETDEWDLEYYRYFPEDVMEYTVTFSNGDTITEYGNGFEYNGEWYWFDVETDQSYEKQWTVGNDYTMTLSLMEYSVDVPVSIVESPIKSIDIAPTSIIEGTEGYLDADYDWETDELSPEYYRYCPEYVIEYTVTFNDGTVVSGTGSDIKYNDRWYWFNVEAEQSYKNRWTVGNTYTITVSLMGVDVEADVSIIETPVKNIIVEPVTLYQGVDSYLEWGYDPETDSYDVQYDYYDYIYDLNYTVVWNDGTTTKATGYDDIEYNGRYYCIDYTDDQSYENAWKVGNSYKASIIFMGKTVELSIAIEQSPVESIELVKAPAKTEYEIGEYINLNGAVLRINYTDGTYEDAEIETDAYGSCIYVDRFDKYYELVMSDESAFADTTDYTISALGYDVTVDISVADSIAEDISIESSGYDLEATITYSDGSQKTMQALGFKPQYGDGDSDYLINGGTLITDCGEFFVVVYENVHTGDFYFELYLGESTIISNTLTLEDSLWWKLQQKIENVAIAIKSQTDYVEVYGGEVTEDNIDELLSVACVAMNIHWDDSNYDGYTYDGYVFYKESVENAFYEVFGFVPDLTLSKNYDAAKRTVEVAINENYYMDSHKYPMSVEQTEDGIIVAVEWYDTDYTQSITFDKALNVIAFDCPRENDVLLGDVNNDGIINILDATEVQKYLAGLVKLDETVLKAADYNGDGVVSIMDATEIQKKLAGLI